MDFRAVTFYFFAAFVVFAALRVITARNPVHSALFLVLAFFTAAGLWMLLEAEFLAIALVLVYVGAVMVLFLFVVMMLGHQPGPAARGLLGLPRAWSHRRRRDACGDGPDTLREILR
jgi:NADH:ubiquinone oxidoreductase subunit 6 (subunit J)